MDDAGEGDWGSRARRPKIILEAMGIEPATRDTASGLTTYSTMLSVISWGVFGFWSSEDGRLWKNRS